MRWLGMSMQDYRDVISRIDEKLACMETDLAQVTINNALRNEGAGATFQRIKAARDAADLKHHSAIGTAAFGHKGRKFG